MAAFTSVDASRPSPRKELGKGLLAAMLKDLGMDREAF